MERPIASEFLQSIRGSDPDQGERQGSLPSPEKMFYSNDRLEL